MRWGIRGGNGSLSGVLERDEYSCTEFQHVEVDALVVRIAASFYASSADPASSITRSSSILHRKSRDWMPRTRRCLLDQIITTEEVLILRIKR